MHVLLDEDIPTSYGDVFVRLGCTVFTVFDLHLRGAMDDVVFRAAQKRRAILVTADLGFADVHRFPPRRHHGIVVVRLPTVLSVAARQRELARLLQRVPPTQFRRRFTVIAPNLIRFRTE